MSKISSVQIQKGSTIKRVAIGSAAYEEYISQGYTPVGGSEKNAPKSAVSSVSNVPSSSPIKTPSASSSSNAGGTYTVKPGDTLYGIYGANWKQLSGYVGDPTKLQPGTILPAPPGGGGKLDYSNVSSLADANDVINADQEKDVGEKTADAEPPTRRTTQEIMEEIESAIRPDTEAPALPQYGEALAEWRAEYGVEALETQLNDLRAQEQDILAQKESRVAAERDKPVAMNVIEGRIGEVERQENERLGAIQRSIANATNQLNTKYNIIDTLMKTKEMDYNAAVSSYDKEFANNISIFNAARNIEESEKSDIEREQDTARANAQIMLNAYADSGLTYDKLSSSEQTNLTKLGVQSGLGADFFSNVLSVSAGKAVLTTIVSADDTKATIIYKDGTTKTISTGLPAKPVSVVKSEEQKEQDAMDKEFETYAKKMADQVFDGKLTREQAKERIRSYYPDYDENVIYDLVQDSALKDILYTGTAAGG